MTNVSKQIYRKLNTLIPDLHKIEPFNRIDLKDKGLPGIEFTIIDSEPDKINFILTRYKNERGQLIANPSIEIIADPKNKIANVKTYKDQDYFHDAVTEPVEVGTIALQQANRFLFDFLNNLKNWNRSLSEKNFLKRSNKTNEGRS